MKKFTNYLLAMLTMLAISQQASARQETLSDDAVKYAIGVNGSWSNVDGNSGYYSTWTSSDGVLTVTSDAVDANGLHNGFQISGSYIIINPGAKQPATITVKAAVGYKLQDYRFFAKLNNSKNYADTLKSENSVYVVNSSSYWTTVKESISQDEISFKLNSSTGGVLDNIRILSSIDYQYINVAKKQSITYDLTKDGKWTSIDRKDFYDTWTSDDGLLTVTSDALNASSATGTHIGFQVQNVSGYQMIRTYPGFTQPSTITFKPAAGFQIGEYFFYAINNWNKSYNSILVAPDKTYTITPYAWTVVTDNTPRDKVTFKLSSSSGDKWSDMFIWNSSGNLYITIVRPTIPTGIENITSAEETTTKNDVIYDLSGRRVTTPSKGIYIINKKKVLIK